MSKLTDQLRALRVFNNHELLARFGSGQDVVLEYSAPAPREVRPAITTVYSPRFKVDSTEHRYRFAKVFCGNKNESFPAAESWASEQFAITDWAVSPFGGRVPAHVLVAAKAAVKSV